MLFSFILPAPLLLLPILQNTDSRLLGSCIECVCKKCVSNSRSLYSLNRPVYEEITHFSKCICTTTNNNNNIFEFSHTFKTMMTIFCSRFLRVCVCVCLCDAMRDHFADTLKLYLCKEIHSTLTMRKGNKSITQLAKQNKKEHTKREKTTKYMSSDFSTLLWIFFRSFLRSYPLYRTFIFSMNRHVRLIL